MATNIYPKLPVDQTNTTLQEYPANILAKQRYAAENATASSVITVGDNTTALEVSAHTTAAVMRWVGSSDTQGSVISAAGTANFDHVIPVSTMRRFAIPIESFPSASIVGANVQNGLYKRVAIKSIGVGSVLLAEF